MKWTWFLGFFSFSLKTPPRMKINHVKNYSEFTRHIVVNGSRKALKNFLRKRISKLMWKLIKVSRLTSDIQEPSRPCLIRDDSHYHCFCVMFRGDTNESLQSQSNEPRDDVKFNKNEVYWTRNSTLFIKSMEESFITCS